MGKLRVVTLAEWETLIRLWNQEAKSIPEIAAAMNATVSQVNSWACKLRRKGVELRLQHRAPPVLTKDALEKLRRHAENCLAAARVKVYRERMG